MIRATDPQDIPTTTAIFARDYDIECEVSEETICVTFDLPVTLHRAMKRLAEKHKKALEQVAVEIREILTK